MTMSIMGIAPVVQPFGSVIQAKLAVPPAAILEAQWRPTREIAPAT
jgi:hypothetical protein